jgi:hypothetical protein
MGGGCAPDGSVTVAQDGKVPSCQINNVPDQQFLVLEDFETDIGQNSGLTLQLIANDYSTVLQTITLKNRGDAWTDETKSFQLNPPLRLTDISSVVLTLVPAGSDDTAHLARVGLYLGNDPLSAGECLTLFDPAGAGLVTQSSPNLVVDVDDPGDRCRRAGPVLSPPSGRYTCPLTVTITDPGNDPSHDQLFVTTDRSRPTGRSPLYGAPLIVRSNETIRAMALSFPLYSSVQMSKMTSGLYICETPPVCPSGQHCCSGIDSTGLCSAGCIDTGIACRPLCSPGFKCCGAAGPTGACDSQCVPNSRPLCP